MDKKDKLIRSTQMGQPARKLFDTLGNANKLKAAGFTEKQAEASTEMLLSVIESHLATTYDLKELETGLKRDMKELETGLRRDMKELETGLKRDMKELETELKRDIKDMSKDIKIWLGSLMGGSIVILGILMKLFH